MQNTDLYTFQREYATKKYLEHCQSRGYGDMEYSQKMITLFWEKVDYYPTYEKECEETRKKMRQSGILNNPDSGKHPDYDYAARYAGISGDYIYNLICVATQLYNGK